LTPPATAPTMRRMTKDVLTKILTRAVEADPSDGRTDIAEEHHLTFYIGQPGRAMAVADVVAVCFEEDFAELTTHETKTTVYVPYDSIHAVSTRPTKGGESRRAGFD